MLRLENNVLSLGILTSLGCPGYYTMRELQQIPYIKALYRFSSPPYKSENYGITAAEHNVNGSFLTIDMCPSVKPFEKTFFQELVSESKKLKRPIPIAISIRGLWLIGHPQEFAWWYSKKN